MLIAFHKPYGVLSQFTPDGSPNRTLALFGLPKQVYALGRLDADSEGLLLLSDEPGLNTQLLDPERGHPRTYWAQIERIPSPETLLRLQGGLDIQGYRTRPCRAWMLAPQPDISPRDPESDAIEAGAQNVEALDSDEFPEGSLGNRFLTESKDLSTVSTWLSKAGWKLSASEIRFVAKSPVELGEAEKAQVSEFLNAIDDHDDVHRLYVGMK